MNNYKLDKYIKENKSNIIENFDFKFYISFYPELINEFHIKKNSKNKYFLIQSKAEEHFFKYGFKEGRLKNKSQLIDNFSPIFYLNFYQNIL